jgi:hypothetical protein
MTMAAKTITLAALEATHGTSKNPGFVRHQARKLAAKLGVPTPAWAFARSRNSHGEFVPVPPPTPSLRPIAVSVADQLVGLELLRGWRKAGDGNRVLVAKFNGAVELHDLTPGARRIAVYADACDAALAVAGDKVAWKRIPSAETPPSHRSRAGLGRPAF